MKYFNLLILFSFLGCSPTTSSPGDATKVLTKLDAALVYMEEQRVGPSSEGDGEADDWLGYSVALLGDVALVGVPVDDIGENTDQGSAYVFTRDPVGGEWSETQKLTAYDGEAGDGFGYSVSLSEDRALVGVPDDGTGNQGSAYVFAFDAIAGTWNEEQKFTASDASSYANFGTSVSLYGDRALIGASEAEADAEEKGAAYVFVRDANTGVWSEEQKLIASDGAVNDAFGFSVSLHGNRALVGAKRDEVGVNTEQGSAYVFVRDMATEQWSEEQKLIASDGVAGERFGTSVSLSLDRALVGKRNAAYVFERDTTTSAWSEEQKLVAADGTIFDRFGESVSLSGDLALVGAHQQDVGVNNEQGSAYLFVRDTATGVWNEEHKLNASNGAGDDWFGFSVSLSVDRAILGSHLGDVGINTDQGSAYVFARDENTGDWNEEQALTSGQGAAGDAFGISVSLSGERALVGACSDNVGTKEDQGSAYVFVRDTVSGGWSEEQKLMAGDGAERESFGRSVSLSGNRAVIGADGYSAFGYSGQGAAYVFVRDANTSVWGEEQKLTASDGENGDGFGSSVSSFGDRVLVGAAKDNVASNSNQGSAYVFARDPVSGVWSEEHKLSASDGATGDNFGSSVSLFGDWALVGAVEDDNGQGSAYLFERDGVTGVWSEKQKLAYYLGSAGDSFGCSVSLSDDRALIGSYRADVGIHSLQGVAHTYALDENTGEFVYEQRLTASDGVDDALFGQSVFLSGDRAVIGATGYDAGGNTDPGAAYVFTRDDNRGSWNEEQKLSATDGRGSDDFGISVSLWGSLVAVGAFWADGKAPHGNPDEGAVYFFFGLADDCSDEPDDTPCDDGDLCTQTDTCQAGSCVGSDEVVCTALDECHDVGTCDPGTGVCSNPVKPDDTPCDDGNLCTQTDTCQAGSCVGSDEVVCTALDECHDVGTCDPGTGVCSSPLKSDGSACDDGNLCTQTDTCQAGSCVGSDEVVCTALDECHDVGTCDPGTGVCSNPVKPDGSACDDGNLCTQTDICQEGSCVGTDEVVCTALDECHDVGTCDPDTGLCSNPERPGPCDTNEVDDGCGCHQSSSVSQIWLQLLLLFVLRRRLLFTRRVHT